MAEGKFITQHLNESNIITNQLLSTEIDFDYKIRALILSALLPNSWEVMRMIGNNSEDKLKMSYDDVQDMILIEEVHLKDSGEFLVQVWSWVLMSEAKNQLRL